MNTYRLIIALTFFCSANGNTALIDRGNGLIYDTDLDISWLADANLASSRSFGVSGIEADGSMFGGTATDWIIAMNNYQGTGYLGYNSWRLTIDNCPSTAGQNCVDSEFGHLFYIELSGTANAPISSSADPDINLFSNIVENDWYWTGSLSSGHIRVFNFGTGSNSRTFGTLAKYRTWAVLDGDVAAVPLPSTLWLFISGIITLVTVKPASKTFHTNSGRSLWQ